MVFSYLKEKGSSFSVSYEFVLNLSLDWHTKVAGLGITAFSRDWDTVRLIRAFVRVAPNIEHMRKPSARRNMATWQCLLKFQLWLEGNACLPQSRITSVLMIAALSSGVIYVCKTNVCVYQSQNINMQMIGRMCTLHVNVWWKSKIDASCT